MKYWQYRGVGPALWLCTDRFRIDRLLFFSLNLLSWSQASCEFHLPARLNCLSWHSRGETWTPHFFSCSEGQGSTSHHNTSAFTSGHHHHYHPPPPFFPPLLSVFMWGKPIPVQLLRLPPLGADHSIKSYTHACLFTCISCFGSLLLLLLFMILSFLSCVVKGYL